MNLKIKGQRHSSDTEEIIPYKIVPPTKRNGSILSSSLGMYMEVQKKINYFSRLADFSS
jgi:hypothetical protein